MQDLSFPSASSTAYSIPEVLRMLSAFLGTEVDTPGRKAGMAAPGPGYAVTMTTTPEPPEDRPIDLEGVPAEEDISAADVSERLEKDPEEQDNKEELS